VGLRPLASYDCSNPAGIYLSVSYQYCIVQVRKVSAKSRSLFHRILTECVCVTNYDEVQQYPSKFLKIRQKT